MKTDKIYKTKRGAQIAATRQNKIESANKTISFWSVELDVIDNEFIYRIIDLSIA